MDQRRISHYRVDRLIGVGGMGEVYLAEDATLQRKVALKLLPERFSEDEERVRRFQREARAASALNHPNIITIYEVGQDSRRHFIATEYIEGQTLRDRMLSHQPMTIAEVLDIAIGVAGALAAAHDAGILHRDIKPENIMLRPDGYVKVLDFGLAKLTDPGAGTDSVTGAVMGTLLYISPEQARGMTPDARSDIYSLGVVLYEMLTHELPVMSDSFVELAIAITTKDPRPPSAIVRSLPPDVDRIVMKALQKEREKRYVSARELLRDLRTLRQELEFEDKLTMLAGGDGRITSPLLLQATAPLTIPAQSTSSVFARLTERVSPRQLASIVLALLCITIIAYAIGRNAMIGDATIDSIAVLPFMNASGDPNSEYLSDGISESIIDSLSQIPQLQVVARSTAFRYKGRSIDPVQVGRELHVRGVVTGQLIQRGNTIVIRAALTDVKHSTHLWGDQYNRKLADVLSVQQEIAEQISNELRTKLSGDEKKMLTRHSGVNSEAYQQYLKGRYNLNKYTEESIRKSIGFFNAAIEIDPQYAAAYAGLANAYYDLSNVYLSPNEAMPRAREAAERAVQLDDSLTEGHTALALVRTWYEWNFPAGEREFRRAIDLNPNDAEAHRYYGDFLIARGEFDRAIAEKKKAEQLDPLSVPASWDVGRAFFYAGRLVEAEQQAKRTIDLDDHFAYAYALRAQIALEQHRMNDAVALAKKALDLSGPKPYFVTMWGYANGIAGHRDQAQAVIAELRSSPGYTLPLFLARINTALGENDEALRWLGKLYDERSESIVWLKVDRTLAPLRNDPRFDALVKRIGI
jgi:serine/threonine protein kinase/Tfp pilus assembly protein PilF